MLPHLYMAFRDSSDQATCKADTVLHGWQAGRARGRVAGSAPAAPRLSRTGYLRDGEKCQ